MKPRNNCGFETIGIAWVIIGGSTPDTLAEMTYASTPASFASALATEGRPARVVSDD
jgi:hypothetical protein